jgi:hypothetical protein
MAAVAAGDAAPARAFTLTIESRPSGVPVMDGDRALGSTPLSLDVDAAGVKRAPRELWLRLAGHVPYRIVQGPSDRDVHVVANLSALAPAAVPAPAARAATAELQADPSRAAEPSRASARKRGTARLKPAQTALPATAPAPAAAGDPSDIRLER